MRAIIWTSLILLFVNSGCWFVGQRDFADIVKEPSSAWTQKDCLTVLFGAQNNNYLDNRTHIKVVAIPYYPSVVKSLGRRAQQKERWSEAQYQRYIDGLLKQGSGLYVDWDHPGEIVYDSKLSPLQTAVQYDSLLFIVTLRNVAWPFNYNPEILDLSKIETKIYLVNDQRKFITPTMVYGRKMNYLTNIDETLFIMFRLREGDHHFLTNSAKYYLSFVGFENDIKLEYPTRLMR